LVPQVPLPSLDQSSGWRNDPAQVIWISEVGAGLPYAEEGREVRMRYRALKFVFIVVIILWLVLWLTSRGVAGA
jgi:hypothetical protein